MERQEVDILLQALKIEDEEEFRIFAMEAIGYLLVMVHWLHGAMRWLRHSRAVKFPVGKEKNYLRLLDSVSLYEEMTWEIAPPRAMLQQLRLWRKKGHLDPDFRKLLIKDSHGRFPQRDEKGRKEAHAVLMRLRAKEQRSG